MRLAWRGQSAAKLRHLIALTLPASTSQTISDRLRANARSFVAQVHLQAVHVDES